MNMKHQWLMSWRQKSRILFFKCLGTGLSILGVSLIQTLLLSHLAWANPISKADATAVAGQLKFEKANLLMDFIFVEGPKNQGESKLKIQFKNPLGSPARIPYGLKVTTFMPDMGHGGSPVKLEPIPGQIGEFYVKKIYFYHNGKWELRFQLFDNAGFSETQVLTLIIDGTYCYQPAVPILK